MTHKVSQTTLGRVDHFEQGEERAEFSAPGKGAHIGAQQLANRIASAVAASAARFEVNSVDITSAFTVDAIRAVAPPLATSAPSAPAARTAQERAELKALARNGGDPAIGDYTGK